MRSVPFGKLTVGDVPRVVGTIASFDSLQRFASASERPCDIAEIRLDEIGVDAKWLSLAQHIEASGTPVILTLRSALEGGKSTLSNDERLAILREAIDHVSAIDVELKSGLATSLRPLTNKTGKALIASFHDFERTPASSELEEIIRDAAKEATVAKISAMASTASDIDRLKGLLAKDWGVPLCVIGMGSLGASTRTDFPRLGSCLTYGYIDAPVAPGQLSARALLDHLRPASAG
jgi:3-dehydroquinate dehydratase I